MMERGFFLFAQKYKTGRIPKMKELRIIKQNGGSYIDSREVAEAIEKRHDHLLRDIGNYLEIIEDFTAPNFGGCDFLMESSYIDVKGRTRLCYLLSKMGCELVANKLIGEKGVLFTAAYVAKFNEMEETERVYENKARSRPRLSEFNSAVRNVLKGMSYCCTHPSRVMDFIRGVYEPLGIEVNERVDENLHYYSATDIARLLDIYSMTGRPHGHAVSAIISRINIEGNHTIVVPYGLVGVMIKYDWFVVETVMNWIAENNKPNEVPYLNFCYHIYYDRQFSLFDNDDDFDDDGFINLDDYDFE